MSARPERVFARRVRDERRRRGWTQVDLISRLALVGMHIGQSTLSMIEGHKRGVPLDDAVALARVLGLSLDELIGKEPPRAYGGAS